MPTTCLFNLKKKKERKALQREGGCLARLIKAAQAGLWESLFFFSMFHPSLPLSHELPRSLDIPPAPDLMSTQTKLLSSIVSCANYCSANLPSGLIPKFIQEAEQLGGSAVNTTYPAGSKAARALRGELSLRERDCWAAGFISLPCRLKHAPMSSLSNQEEKEMFSLPGPWVRVN